MSDSPATTCRLVVIGVSTGGVTALRTLLGGLPIDFPAPVLIVAHISPEAGDGLAQFLDEVCAIRVKEADEGELAEAGTVYLAPANYHLLIERNGTLSLTTDAPVNFARPAVDVLFEAAAHANGAEVIGVVLTGAGSDGSKGLAVIRRSGGVTIVQTPADAEIPAMPQSALAETRVDHQVPLAELAELLQRLVGGGE